MLPGGIRKESDRLKDQYKAFRTFLIPSQFCGILFGIMIFAFLGSEGTEYDAIPYIELVRILLGIATLIFLTVAIVLYVFSYQKSFSQMLILLEHPTTIASFCDML